MPAMPCAGAFETISLRQKADPISPGSPVGTPPRGSRPVSLPNRTRRRWPAPPGPTATDREQRSRWVERLRARLKERRTIATRYEKTAHAFMGVLCLAAALDWLKS
nr:transposase [Geminicoccus roseus]